MKNKITVSNTFLDIYKMFSVTDQISEMNKLSRKELLLLIILAIDSFSEDNIAVINNLKPFKDEVILVYNFLEDKIVDDVDIDILKKETSDEYISTSNIVDQSGQPLPNPLTENESTILRREIQINSITN